MVKINPPEGALLLIKILHQNGYEASLVGGCVRDSLLGIEPNDWDICTNCLPEKVIEIFKDYKVIPTGLKHGTVTIVVNEESYEISSGKNRRKMFILSTVISCTTSCFDVRPWKHPLDGCQIPSL